MPKAEEVLGQKGASTREEDFVEEMIMAYNHDYMLFFTEQGKCFWLKVYEIPEGGKTTAKEEPYKIS